jgi:ABC-type bacteriocin/lantibiotic exporter with double-glycine peptidase domain
MLRYLTDPPVPQPMAIARTGDNTPAKSVWRFVWRMSGDHQIWICLLASVVAGLSMAPLELQRVIVNDAIQGRNLNALALYGGLYLVVMLLLTGTKLAFNIYQAWLTESTNYYVRGHLTDLHRQRVTERDNKRDDAGRLVPIVHQEAEEVGGFVGEGISGPFVQGGTFVAILGYMLVTEPLLAAIAAVFLLPQIVLMPMLQRFINRLIASRIELQRELATLIAQITPDSDEVPSESELRSQIGSVYRNRMRIAVLKFLGKMAVNTLNNLAPLAALVVGGYLAIEGQTTLGVVVAFVSGFDRLSDPLRQLIAYYRLYARVRVQHQKIAEWMT